MLTSDFLTKFKHASEAKWHARPINPRLYGFQFQPGTRWNPGLSDDKIAEYGNVLGVRFPSDFQAFLRAMNGTDLPTLSIYGYRPEPPNTSIGFYSYPRDLKLIQRLMEEIREDRAALTTTLAEQGFDLPPTTNLVPINEHRYLVCSPDSDTSVVISVLNAEDATVVGNSLQEYLEAEFLREAA
jgi:hypothetical protein